MKRSTFKNIILCIFIPLIFIAGMVVSKYKEKHQQSDVVNQEIWTCPMHPQVRNPGPGKCPLCSMDLIKLEENQLGERQIELSAYARKMANIQTRLVEKRIVEKEIRLSGTVVMDETKVSIISSRFPGRLDKLYVDYTGITVNKGDHLVYIYSPEMLTAQEELLQAKKAVKSLKDSQLDSIRKTTQATLDASREKLRLWGVDAAQIKKIEERGVVSDHFTINAPSGGIVIQKNAKEGIYVKTGTPIYKIADLSTVWVTLDVYESDMQWLRYGQRVELHSNSFPGEKFYGKVAFIDPLINPKTRTLKMRVNIKNKSLKLKPGIFVTATVISKIAKNNKVVDPSLKGKWIGPMHPEIVKDEAGKCDICGMKLVQAEDLGYTSAEDAEAALVIPATAALITGKRAVVYVQSPTNESIFEGREIVLGHRAGDYYIVKSGLEVGEKVGVNGNFKLDSALQIQAKKSMMSDPALEGSSESEKEGATKSAPKKPKVMKHEGSHKKPVEKKIVPKKKEGSSKQEGSHKK